MKNVRDHLKELTVEAIKNYCAASTMPAAIAMTHIEGDFNLSNVLRSANFFGFRDMFYIGGGRQWDKRGAVGTHHYTPITYIPTIEEFFKIIDGRYIPIALENNVQFPMQNLFDYRWPDSPVIIVGEEQLGLSNDVLTKCQTIVTIPSHGSVRSLNVSTAAGTAMGLVRSQYENNKQRQRI